MKLNKKLYWNKFYKNFSIDKESNFARFCFKFMSKGSSLLDIACGNGRDTFFFIKRGINCKGIDISKIAIKKNSKKVKKVFFAKNACTRNLNLNQKFDFIYSRFFLHTINKDSEKKFLSNLKKIMKKNSLVFLEFRTIKDPLSKKGKKISYNETFSDHYRRFIDVSELSQTLKKIKLKITYKSTSYNFAKFGNEKPHICRLILKKKLI